MDETAFWRLCRLIRPYMSVQKPVSKGRGARKKNGAKNGVIPTPTKLSAALRWFAGGSAYDIAVAHGISHTDVFRAVWRVVDAVNKCPELSFNFPEDYPSQWKIAEGFFSNSKAGFTQCCGAIDGILIWMEKPSDISCEEAKCGPKKFFCGRKKKFGMNLQGTVDHHGRFLHMSIWHPASTSDYLAFSTMDLFHKLERPGFLAPGLCLFGDNAYVNTPYMATPFKNVGSGSKDDYNFYHSQVRIKVECAFGQLVHRWGVLRRPLSAKVTMKKVNCLCMALCRLHNYCINSRLKPDQENLNSSTPRHATAQGEDLTTLASDEVTIAMNAGVDLDQSGRPEELLHGGEHFEDVPDSNMRTWRRAISQPLPRDVMWEHVKRTGFKRPMPKRWRDRAPAQSA